MLFLLKNNWAFILWLKIILKSMSSANNNNKKTVNDYVYLE